MERIEFKAMGTQVLAVVDRDGETIMKGLGQVPNWFERWEQCLSRFRPDSELSKINIRAAAETCQVSAVMGEVIQTAQRAYRESDGLVTPGVLNALMKAGYDRDFDEISTVEEETTIRNPVEIVDPKLERWMDFNRHARKLRLASGAGLDLGGVAKGWAADRAAHRLKRLGPALVDAGGDISVNGPMANGEPWLIGVSDPTHPERRIDQIGIVRGGVATSGKDRRVWKRNGGVNHHIIDPRSGNSAVTDVKRATVIGPSARRAETAAKVIVISGSQEGLDWLEARPEYAGLLILENNEIIYSRRWVYYSWR